MPQFEYNKVKTLLNFALAKAGVELNRIGFDRLCEEIKKHKDGSLPILTKKYIDERIHHQLKTAHSSNQNPINLKQEYLDELSSYLGFEGYESYEKKYDSTAQFIKNKDFKRDILLIIADEENIEFVSQKCKESLYLKQKNPFEFKALKANDINQIDSLNNYYKSKSSILFLSDQLDHQLLNKVNQDYISENSIIPIAIPHDDTTLNKQSSSFKWLAFDDFEFFIQILLSSDFNTEAITKNQSSNSIETQNITNINDSGTVILGKIESVNAEYISSRDMHININKSDSKD